MSELRGSLSREPPPYEAGTSYFSIRAGHPNPGTVVTFGLLRREYRGSIRREPPQGTKWEEVSGGPPFMGPAPCIFLIRTGHPDLVFIHLTVATFGLLRCEYGGSIYQAGASSVSEL